MKRQPLDELVQSHRVRAVGVTCLQPEGAERVDDDEPGVGLLDFVDNSLEHGGKVVPQHFLGQINEAHRRPNELGPEEAKLALVANHLERRLAEDREIQRRPLDGRVVKDDLLRQRGLPRARAAGDKIEREFRQAAA